MGTLIGIARHGRARGPIEELKSARVTIEDGLVGDHRGAIRPGGSGKRQVTLMALADWEAATAETGHDLRWSARRVNLLVAGLDVPHVPGVLLRIGDVLLEITRECDPCSRMEEIAPGLKAALTRDWRGGVCTRVLAGGMIAIGDTIGIGET